MSKGQSFPSFLLTTFIDNTTLRGIRKCCSTKHRVLRFLWLCYLISMALILGYGTWDLLAEFFEYHKSYQIEERLSDPTPFPSLTICSLNPFSPEAARLWREGRVPSPADFSRLLRRGMGQFARQGRYAEAASLFHSDKVTTYFQYINESAAKQLAHRYSDLVPFCVMRHSANANPSVAHEEDCQFQETSSLHHPEFFFCHDLELVQPDSSYVSSLSILLSNAHFNDVLSHNFNLSASELEGSGNQEHAFNVFNQASGFRIALHEPGVYPLIDTDSFSVQMETSTLIKYRTIKVENLNYPTGECADARDLPDIQDDDNTYRYTYAACLSSHIGQLIRQKCNCTSTYHVRPSAKSDGNSRAPYCSYFNASRPSEFIRRLDCVRNLNLSSLTSAISQTACQKRCSFFRYESQLSSANWSPQLWQIHWMSHISSAFNQVTAKADGNARENLEQLLAFSELDSISSAPQVAEMRRFEKQLSRKMALVTVSRLGYNTMVNRETLQISPSALLSRLGGLGGLTLGVTLTCAFELLELVYFACRRLVRGGGGGGDRAQAGEEGVSVELNGRSGAAAALPSGDEGGDEDADNQLPLLATRPTLPSFYDNCPTEDAATLMRELLAYRDAR